MSLQEKTPAKKLTKPHKTNQMDIGNKTLNSSCLQLGAYSRVPTGGGQQLAIGGLQHYSRRGSIHCKEKLETKGVLA